MLPSDDACDHALAIPPDVQHSRDRAAELQRVLVDAYEVACDHGFAPCTWPLVPTKLAFAMTELREAEGTALAAHIGDPADAWATEVLDYVIRVGGVLVGLWGTEWCVRPIGTYMPRVRLQAIEVTLWPLARHACDAIQAWRGGERHASRVQYQCERGVATGIAIYEQATGRDAIEALRAVVDRNRERPMRHGHVEGVA